MLVPTAAAYATQPSPATGRPSVGSSGYHSPTTPDTGVGSSQTTPAFSSLSSLPPTSSGYGGSPPTASAGSGYGGFPPTASGHGQRLVSRDRAESKQWNSMPAARPKQLSVNHGTRPLTGLQSLASGAPSGLASGAPGRSALPHFSTGGLNSSQTRALRSSQSPTLPAPRPGQSPDRKAARPGHSPDRKQVASVRLYAQPSHGSAEAQSHAQQGPVSPPGSPEHRHRDVADFKVDALASSLPTSDAPRLQGSQRATSVPMGPGSLLQARHAQSLAPSADKESSLADRMVNSGRGQDSLHLTMESLNPPPTQLVLPNGPPSLPPTALRLVPPMPEEPSNDIPPMPIEPQEQTRADGGDLVPRKVCTLDRQPSLLEKSLVERQSSLVERQSSDSYSPRRKEALRATQEEQPMMGRSFNSSPTFVSKHEERSATPGQKDRAPAPVEEARRGEERRVEEFIGSPRGRRKTDCGLREPRRSGSKELAASAQDTTSKQMQRLIEENEYWKKNVAHLRNVKRTLESHIRSLDVRNKWLEKQMEQHKVLYQQHAVAATGGNSMEIQNLHDQLEAVMSLKKALNTENLELQRRLEAKEEKEASQSKQATCVVCMDNLANVVSLPCKHLSMCMFCAKLEKSELCPICRKTVTEKMQIYCP